MPLRKPPPPTASAASSSAATSSSAAPPSSLPTLQPVDRVEEVYTHEYHRLRGLARKSEVMLGCVSLSAEMSRQDGLDKAECGRIYNCTLSHVCVCEQYAITAPWLTTTCTNTRCQIAIDRKHLRRNNVHNHTHTHIHYTIRHFNSVARKRQRLKLVFFFHCHFPIFNC